jgi:hypothetical protein
MKSIGYKFLAAGLLSAALSLSTNGAGQSQTVDGVELGQTPTWAEAVAAFQKVAVKHPLARMREFGTSDVGRPLHLFEFGDTDAPVRLLINNAIHPGEPCGVNACLALVDSLSAATLNDPGSFDANVLIGIVPMYNVGGGLRRNCCTRANQNGPEAYGFRGNARNLDLNRDFVKCDSRNALAFNKLIAQWKPDVFVDTHTSNGADYEATMTLITTQPDKLGGPLGAWLKQVQLPRLYAGMKAAGWPMTPYMNTVGERPEEGIADFMESPRYSTGFTALHHIIGFTTEAHMLKPFADRVAATTDFLQVLLRDISQHGDALLAARAASVERCAQAERWPVAWAIDREQVDSIYFGGYTAKKIWSPISGSARTYYDHEAPFWDSIPYYHTAVPTAEVSIPNAYVVPQAWRHVIERLRANSVALQRIPRDTTFLVEVLHIERHHALDQPYEGHHLRTADSISAAAVSVQLFAGDFIVPTDQPARRYVIETLEPRATDSFFTWNFFDACLQQKEYFSPYVFEATAVELLADPVLAQEFESALEQSLAGDSALAQSPRARLNWIYLRSPHHEGTADRYPIYRLN